MNTCGKCAYMNGDGFCRLLSKPRGYFDNGCDAWNTELPKFNKFMSKEETTRTCKACGRELPLEDFPKDAHGGHIHTCKECHAERLHARRRPGTPRAGLKKVKKDSQPQGKAKPQPPVPADDPKIAIDPKIKELIDENPNGARFALENFCMEAAVKYSAAYGPVEGLRQFFKDMIEQYEHLGRHCHLQNGEPKPQAEPKPAPQPPVPADDPKIAEEIAASEVEAQDVPTWCNEATDQELFDELRKRGWEGYLVKTMSTPASLYPTNVSFAKRFNEK